MNLAARSILSLATALLLHLPAPALLAQQPPPAAALDSDHDGLSDTLEQQLLTQFAPRFMVGEQDCSVRPAEFRPEVTVPDAVADNGTIYGQAFPAHATSAGAPLAELHFYHLWRRDCGEHGHPLDTEHVAVLVRASGPDLATWKAVYWYAAAHENTVCDVSQLARSQTLHAEDHGATVWISPGKHASYLNDTLCHQGCGADRCEKMTALQPASVINLGEPGHPMNGSLFIASVAWPLQAKMSATNFPPAPLARLDQLPTTDIAWFNPGRHPMQGVIAHSSSTGQALATSGRNSSTAIRLAGNSTGGALATANDSTDGALSSAESSTGNALTKSYRHTRHALGSSVRHVGGALHLTPRDEEQNPPPR